MSFGQGPEVGLLRFLLRSTALLVLIVYGMLMIALLRLDFWRRLKPEPMASHWSRLLLGLLNMRLRVRGAVPMEGGRMIVANHVSWIDIQVMCAVASTRFVSKSEVQHWPVAGWLADAAGTFYIRRGKGGARPLLNELLPFLQAGGAVTIFPEGTTSDGRDVLPFHPRLFCAAIDSRRPVQPVALRYGLDRAGHNIAPFIGDDDLVSHLLRLLRCRGLDVEVSFGRPLQPEGATREELAEAARSSIREALAHSMLETATDTVAPELLTA
ncbi:hypothetical protein B1810_05035 [Panacagrimonas perspica]|nr:hypothetical protein B1810_05035 [Panacagrimonas perspica]